MVFYSYERESLRTLVAVTPSRGLTDDSLVVMEEAPLISGLETLS